MTFAALDCDTCPHCGLYTGWTGQSARNHPLRKHLACQCPTEFEMEERVRATVERELRFLMEKDKAA